MESRMQRAEEIVAAIERLREAAGDGVYAVSLAKAYANPRDLVSIARGALPINGTTAFEWATDSWAERRPWLASTVLQGVEFRAYMSWDEVADVQSLVRDSHPDAPAAAVNLQAAADTWARMKAVSGHA